jgi:hypothetical protein
MRVLSYRISLKKKTTAIYIDMIKFEYCVCNRLWYKVKGKFAPVLNLIKHYAMKAYGGVDV